LQVTRQHQLCLPGVNPTPVVFASVGNQHLLLLRLAACISPGLLLQLLLLLPLLLLLRCVHKQ
jgi:hypothetical protein